MLVYTLNPNPIFIFFLASFFGKTIDGNLECSLFLNYMDDLILITTPREQHNQLGTFVNDFDELCLFYDLKFTSILDWFPWVIPISSTYLFSNYFNIIFFLIILISSFFDFFFSFLILNYINFSLWFPTMTTSLLLLLLM